MKNDQDLTPKDIIDYLELNNITIKAVLGHMAENNSTEGFMVSKYDTPIQSYTIQEFIDTPDYDDYEKVLLMDRLLRLNREIERCPAGYPEMTGVRLDYIPLDVLDDLDLDDLDDIDD